MPDRLPSLVFRHFRQFWGFARGRILVVVGLTLVMTYAEGIGIALFFPLFEPAGQHGTTGLSGTITRALDAVNIAMTPGSVLPLIMILFLVKGVLQWSTFRYMFSLSRMMTRRLRRRALNALAKADYQHVAGANAGFHTNFLINEINRATSGFQAYLRSISPALSAGVLFTIVCFLDWRLSLTCIVMGVIMIGVTRVAGFIIRRHSLIYTKESAKLTGLLIQILHGFKYLRATGSYARFDQRVWESSERMLEADFKLSTANAFVVSMSQPIMVVFLGSLLYYRSVIQGAELASLFVLLLYFFRVMNEVFALQSSWQTFCGYVGSIELVNETVEGNEQAAESVGSERFDGLSDAIVLDKVGYSYRTGGRVLDDISLRIMANTTVAFVGGSGAGKSTLVDLVTGTLKASAGRVTMDEQDLATMDLSTLRSRIGYVPQDAALFDDTVAANIMLWSDAYSHDQVREAAQQARCLEFIEKLPNGFETQVGDRGVKLSGGQRQRLAIARELLRKPDILVLDEATSALDSESEQAIQHSIEHLKGKMTIIIIAHRLSTIRGADHVYVLSEAKIVEDGGFGELAARPNGRFRRMCELQEVAP